MKRLIENIKSIYKYRFLLEQLVSNNIRLKYRRSILGYIWSVLNPLLIMLILTLVFSTIFNQNIDNFPVYLLTGRLCFDFLSEATKMGMNSIIGNASLLKKTYVPKFIFPIASTTSSFINFIFALGALVIVMVVTRCIPSWHILLFIFVIIELYVFILGLSLFLAQFNTRFRDTQYIYNAFLTAWMYLTPIFYPAELLNETLLLRILSRLNPMYSYVQQARDVILRHQLPGNGIVIAGILSSIVMLAVGLLSFYKNQDKFIFNI